MAIEGDYCIDVGSEFCPCYLAELNSCIMCGHLKNDQSCSNCNWRGVCIYNEYHFLNYEKRDTRDYQEVEIIKKEIIGEKLLIFTLRIPKILARQLKQPGSYIFIRNKNLEHFFDTPISIMEVDEDIDEITIAIEIYGVKTKSIKEVKDTLLIKGPYWNGLFGLEHFKKAKGSKCLVLARGVAQAPAVLAINYLMRNNNEVDAVIDLGKANINLIREYTKANVIREGLKLYSPEVIEMLHQLLNTGDYQSIFIAGSDNLQNKLLEVFNDYPNQKIVVTNNKVICCGEGICGSCIVHDLHGIPIRSCKTQIVIKK